jgi:hypothetical protein
MKGYRNEKELPAYRQAKANPTCTLSYGLQYQANQPMPMMIFQEQIRQMLIKLPLDQFIKSIEETATGF